MYPLEIRKDNDSQRVFLRPWMQKRSNPLNNLRVTKTLIRIDYIPGRQRRMRRKLKVLDATLEVPFKQVILATDFREDLEQQWKDAILIKVLGKP